MHVIAAVFLAYIVVYNVWVSRLDCIIKRDESFLWQPDEWISYLWLHNKVDRAGVQVGAITQGERLSRQIPATNRVSGVEPRRVALHVSGFIAPDHKR